MSHDGKNPVMVEAGKKAALTRAMETYTFDEHLEGKPERIQDLTLAVREFVTDLDPAIEEVPKKFYIAYYCVNCQSLDAAARQPIGSKPFRP